MRAGEVQGGVQRPRLLLEWGLPLPAAVQGKDCEIGECLVGGNNKTCSGNGKCVNGRCECSSTLWTGSVCDTVGCPSINDKQCSGKVRLRLFDRKRE